MQRAALAKSFKMLTDRKTWIVVEHMGIRRSAREEHMITPLSIEYKSSESDLENEVK